jgi:hypothetical protein
MWGPEYLVYIPTQKVFATFFMGTKSARREAPALKALLRQAATLGSHEIKTEKYVWWSPQIRPCTTPFEIPTPEDIKEVYEEFMNPESTDVERVDESEKSEGRAQ